MEFGVFAAIVVGFVWHSFAQDKAVKAAVEAERKEMATALEQGREARRWGDRRDTNAYYNEYHPTTDMHLQRMWAAGWEAEDGLKAKDMAEWKALTN